MELLSVVSFTHFLAFLFGFFISIPGVTFHKSNDSVLNSKTLKLFSVSFRCFSKWISLDNARARKASKILDQVQVELLDR